MSPERARSGRRARRRWRRGCRCRCRARCPGWPAAMRVMSRNPPAARRSSARCSSLRSSARRMSVAAARWGTCDTTATSSSWRSGGRATTSAPSDADDLAHLGVRGGVGALGGGEHPRGALEQLGGGALDALLLGAGHRVAAHEAGDRTRPRRSSAFTPPTSVTSPAPAPRARRASSATACTGVATNVMSAVGVVAHGVEGARAPGPGRRRSGSWSRPVTCQPLRRSAQADRPADQAGADHHGPARGAAGRPAHAVAPSGREVVAQAARALEVDVVQVAAGAGRYCRWIITRMQRGVPPSMSSSRAQIRGTSPSPNLRAASGRERRVDVVGGGEQHADQVVVVRRRCARTARRGARSPARTGGPSRRRRAWWRRAGPGRRMASAIHVRTCDGRSRHPRAAATGASAGGGPLERPDLVLGERRATPPAAAGGRPAARCAPAPGGAPGGRPPRTCAGPGGCGPRGW